MGFESLTDISSHLGGEYKRRKVKGYEEGHAEEEKWSRKSEEYSQVGGGLSRCGQLSEDFYCDEEQTAGQWLQDVILLPPHVFSQ